MFHALALSCSNGAQAPPLRHSLGRHETVLQLLACRLSGLNDRAVDEMLLRAGGAKFVMQVNQYYADVYSNTAESVDKLQQMTEERLATMSAEEREHGMELVEEVARMWQETLLHAIHVFHVRPR